MPEVSIAVLTTDRQTRRQIARSLRAGGMRVTFLEDPEQTRAALTEGSHRLLILDCDGDDASLQAALHTIDSEKLDLPVILVSLRPEKGPMLSLIASHEISHLVAKHGAIRVSKANAARPQYATVDERELRVTCDKVLSGDIFGIEKYIGAWGVAFHRRTIRSIKDKTPFLDEFDAYVRDLEVHPPIIPEMVTVAEEFLLNAIVHAPRDKDGNPRYEHIGPVQTLTLEENEWVEVVYGCDGQRLMISVTDNFGTLSRKTLLDYLRRGFGTGIEPETKPSGAGLGLSLSMRNIHQLIFNVHEKKRTEAIAGWFLRIQSASEFKQVGKSLNLFYVDAERKVPEQKEEQRASVYLRGRIDETFDFGNAAEAAVVDLREVSTVTSRGLLRWIQFVKGLAGKNVELVAFPESLIFQATAVNGVIDGVRIRSTLVPYECPSCGFEERREVVPEYALRVAYGDCPECKTPMRFAGMVSEFEAFLEAMRQHSLPAGD